MTSETIEVHLTYLRSGFNAMQAALPILRDKIDLLSAKVNSEIEKTNAKIEKANEQRAAGDALLAGKIDKLTEKVLEDRGQLKAVVWLLGVTSVFASLASIARTLNWI